MIDVITAAEMRRIERMAIDVVGIPGAALMETAAHTIAQEVMSMVGPGKSALFLCGPGNNGGDGFAAARWHMQMGGRAVVVALSDMQGGDARVNRTILEKMGVRIHSFIPESIVCDIIVDAMFGTGFHGDLSSEYLGAARYVNASRKPVLSVDMPSGVDGDTGGAYYAVRADRTLTFAYTKLGHYLYPGREYAGKVVVCDIGLPKAVETKPCARILTPQDIAGHILKARRPNTFKGDYGHALIVAGSKGMAGAAVLAAQGALKGGAGLVTVGCGRDNVLPIVQSGAYEAMAYPLSETPSGGISPDNDFDALVRGKRVLAMGCGLRADSDTREVVERLMHCHMPTVLDADGLNVSGGKFHEYTVITPHAGEMARLTGKTAQQVVADPYGTAVEYAAKKNIVVLLKGSTTIIANPAGDVTLNLTGTPAMATGGSGDVLTGLIAALLAQGLSTYDAARVGAYLHGLSGELAEKRLGTQAVTAQDIAAHLFAAFKQVASGV